MKTFVVLKVFYYLCSQFIIIKEVPMDTKAHITLESSKLLQRIGPTSMTMDMVARACGISKRTLYEKFPDKRTLLKECIDWEHKRQNLEIKSIFETSDNCFAALFNVYTHVRRYFEDRSMAYIDDLRRLYPDLFVKQREQERHFVEQLSEVLRKAQDEGHVLPFISTDIAAFLFLATMRNLNENENIADYGFKRIEVFDGAFLNFLRGIATHDGRQIIDSHAGDLRREVSE